MPLLPLLLLAASAAAAPESPTPGVRLGSPRSIAAEPSEAIDDPAFAIPIDGPRAPSIGGLTGTVPPVRLGAKILFVNFDGAQMNGFCGNDPHNDCSDIFDGVVLAYSGDEAKRASVIQVIRARVEDFGITITNLRPDSGDYDMEMVGNWQGIDPNFAGVAPSIDCFDDNGGEVSFTLESSGTADGIAEIVLQEAAHTWGLEHVNVQTDLLFPTTSGSNKTFTDDCAKIVEDTMLNESDGWCNQVHTNFCDAGWQNSYQELLMVFGPSVPDTIAPTVAIVEPAEGAETDGNFSLVVTFADDQSPVVVDATITIESAALPMPVEVTGAYAGPTELTFPIEGLPEGDYTVRVAITDESANPAEDEVAFTVVFASADTSGGDAETSGGSDDGPPAETTGAGPETGGPVDPTDTGNDDGGTTSSGGTPLDTTDKGGCACALDRRRGLGFVGLLALGLVARRRRL